MFTGMTGTQTLQVWQWIVHGLILVGVLRLCIVPLAQIVARTVLDIYALKHADPCRSTENRANSETECSGNNPKSKDSSSLNDIAQTEANGVDTNENEK